MSRPTHVYVGRPVKCSRCNGTGEMDLGFMRLPNGKALCDACNGAKMTHEAMPIEDFAKLFETVEPLQAYGPNVFRSVPLAVKPSPPESDE